MLWSRRELIKNFGAGLLGVASPIGATSCNLFYMLNEEEQIKHLENIEDSILTDTELGRIIKAFLEEYPVKLQILPPNIQSDAEEETLGITTLATKIFIYSLYFTITNG